MPIRSCLAPFAVTRPYRRRSPRERGAAPGQNDRHAPSGLLLRPGFDSALAHGLGKMHEQRPAVLPPQASVGDALTVDQLFSGHQILAARLQMAFRHDAEYAIVAAGDLACDVMAHVNLFLRILAAVGMTEVDHEPGRNSRFSQAFGGGVHAGGTVIGLLAAAQNDVAVLVPAGRDD